MPVVNRYPRPRIPPARTPESVRKEAKEHFAAIVERPVLFELTPEQAQDSARWGELLLEALLVVSPEEYFEMGDFFVKHKIGEDQAQRTLVIGMMPYVAHSLRLADLEFVHEELGVLPMFEVVRELLTSSEPVPYKGFNLTKESVLVKYRRRKL